MIEGPYQSVLDLMADPNSTTRHLIDFAGAAEDAVKRANADKAEIKRLTEEKP